MRRPADKDILDYVDECKIASSKQIYGHFGAKNNTERSVMYNAMNSLVRYKFVERITINGMYYYRRI